MRCRLDGELALEFPPEGELVERLGVGLASFRTVMGSREEGETARLRSVAPTAGGGGFRGMMDGVSLWARTWLLE